jgi:hypothetical protein
MAIENITRITQYRDTKTNVEALDGALEEGAISYATDTGELGLYTNGAWVWFSSGASAADVKAKVSSGDTTTDYLFSKLAAGTNITLTKNNPGGNETITITAASGSFDPSTILVDDSFNILIDDSGNVLVGA